MDSNIEQRVRADDMTAKARIRNAAMELYAEYGEGGTSVRAIAAAAGVTSGLVVHHFKTKDGIRSAVDQLIVDYFAHAIEQAPPQETPGETARSRDLAVERMLESNPAVVNYLRRAVLDPTGPRGRLLERLAGLTRTELEKARRDGLASTSRAESVQVVDIIVRQLGRLFLQPLIDNVWEHVGEPGVAKPLLAVSVRSAGASNST